MCRNFRGFLAHRVGDTLNIYRGSCKQWKCPDCAPLLRAKWRSHLMRELERLSEPFWAFFTITAPSYGDDDFQTQRDKSYKLFKRQWNPFFTALKRYLGYKPQYIRTFELQERGAVHAHVLINTNFLTLKRKEEGENAGKEYEAWMNDNASSFGFGFMTHATNLLTVGSSEDDNSVMAVAFYVVKYMSKGGTQEIAWLPKNARYIQTSRGFKPMNDRSKKLDGEWFVVGNNLKIETGFYQVYDVMKKKFVELRDLDENFEYH